MIRYYLLLINVIAYWIMYYDKLQAKKGGWRVAEATLLLISAAGGCYGMFLGMYAFHHKTRKAKFYITVPVLMIMYLILIIKFRGIL